MHRLARTRVALALVTTALAAPLAAQDPITAKAPAVWVSGGIGPGWMRLSCPAICIGDRNRGWSPQVAFGARVGPQWLVGLQATGFLDEREGIRERALFAGATARWYPTRASRLWLKLSAGVLTWRADDPEDPDDEPFTASPLAAEFGVGYDVPLSARLRLVPYAAFTGSTGGAVKVDGDVVTDDPNFSLLQLGLSVTWR